MILEEKDIEVEGKVFVEGKNSIECNHDVTEEENKSEAEEDADFMVWLQGEKQFHGLAVQNDDQWALNFNM